MCIVGNETPWVNDFLYKKNTRLPPGSLSSSKSRPAADYWNASQLLNDKENSSSSRKRDQTSDILIAQYMNRNANGNSKVAKLNHVPDHSNKLAAMQIDSLGRLVFEKAYSVSKRLVRLNKDLEVAMNRYIETNGKGNAERKEKLDQVTSLKAEIQKLEVLKGQCSDVVNSLYSMVQGELTNSSNSLTDDTSSKNSVKQNEISQVNKSSSPSSSVMDTKMTPVNADGTAIAAANALAAAVVASE